MDVQFWDKVEALKSVGLRLHYLYSGLPQAGILQQLRSEMIELKSNSPLTHNSCGILYTSIFNKRKPITECIIIL